MTLRLHRPQRESRHVHGRRRQGKAGSTCDGERARAGAEATGKTSSASVARSMPPRTQFPVAVSVCPVAHHPGPRAPDPDSLRPRARCTSGSIGRTAVQPSVGPPPPAALVAPQLLGRAPADADRLSRRAAGVPATPARPAAPDLSFRAFPSLHLVFLQSVCILRMSVGAAPPLACPLVSSAVGPRECDVRRLCGSHNNMARV